VATLDGDKPSTTESDAPLDIDLYCLNCGYNLRGLPGDPVRCPECFHENARADLLCPPDEVQRRVRRMHRYADFCVVISFLFVASLIGAAAAREPACLVCGILALPMAWGICVTHFKNACLSEPGWSRTLLRINAYGLAWVVSSAVFLSLIGLATWFLLGSKLPPLFMRAWVWVLVAVLAITVGFVLAGRRYGRLVDELERLARAGVRFEQDELRRRAQQA